MFLFHNPNFAPASTFNFCSCIIGIQKYFFSLKFHCPFSRIFCCLRIHFNSSFFIAKTFIFSLSLSFLHPQFCCCFYFQLLLLYHQNSKTFFQPSVLVFIFQDFFCFRIHFSSSFLIAKGFVFSLFFSFLYLQKHK